MSVRRHAMTCGTILVACLIGYERQVATAGDAILFEETATVATADDAKPPHEEGSPLRKSPYKTKKARLDVTIRQHRGEWLVKITLRNTGDVPIIVDRELVMGVAVEVDGPDESRIREESGRVPQRSTQEERRKRLISLPPSQVLSRTISLKQGWRVLRGGQGIDSQQRTIAVTGYEEILRLPTNVKPRSVTVRYGTTALFWEGFLGYMGISPREAGLYLGPLEQTIELVEEP